MRCGYNDKVTPPLPVQSWYAMPDHPLKPPLASTNGEHSGKCAELTPTRRIRSRAKPGWKRVFVEALGEHGTIKAACKAAGVSRMGYLKATRSDPTFAAAVQDATADAADTLVEEARRRGLDHSDRLLLGMIRRHDLREAAQTPRVVEHRHGLAEDLAGILDQIIMLKNGELGQAPASSRKQVEALPLSEQPPPTAGPAVPLPNSAVEGTP
jgi:hypothetical protein